MNEVKPRPDRQYLVDARRIAAAGYSCSAAVVLRLLDEIDTLRAERLDDLCDVVGQYALYDHGVYTSGAVSMMEYFIRELVAAGRMREVRPGSHFEFVESPQ